MNDDSDVYPDGADELARLSDLYEIADEGIAAEMGVLPAAVWLKPDRTLGKAPLLAHGHLGAHHDRQLIRQQLIDPPLPVPEGATVVVAWFPGAGDFVVLDCDVKGGKGGKGALAALLHEHGNFVTSAWTSPSAGLNVLTRKPPGAVYGNQSPWPGIDVRADRGWVVAPGNRCPGGAWEWAEGDVTTASELPAGMAEQLRSPTTASEPEATDVETRAFIEGSPTTSSLPAMQKFAHELEWFRDAQKGSRHDGLVSIVSWAFGMHALDLRWAMEQIEAVWVELMKDEPKERMGEVADVARWVVGQEQTKRAAQVVPLPPTGEVRFRRWSVTELLAEDRTFAWDVVGMLSRPTYGVTAGELKTLKSYFGLARDVGLAAGVPVLGRWRVPERRRVLVFVAEGGRKPYTSRLERMAAAYGVSPASLEGWLEVIDDVAPLDSAVFRDALAWHLRDFAPTLVDLDPLYPFQPTAVNPSQYTEVGAMLTGAHRLCADEGATFWFTAHMNQTGGGFDLKRISGAGHGEWADSWLLLKHRSNPDVDAGRFRLRVEVGSRQWSGSTWDVDLNVGRFIPDLGLHDGPITWTVKTAASSGVVTGGGDPLADFKVEALKVGHMARKPLTRQGWLARMSGKNEMKRAAFDELVDVGQIVPTTTGKSPTFELPQGP